MTIETNVDVEIDVTADDIIRNGDKDEIIEIYEELHDHIVKKGWINFKNYIRLPNINDENFDDAIEKIKLNRLNLSKEEEEMLIYISKRFL